MTTPNNHLVALRTLPRPSGLPVLGNLLQIDPTRIHLILENWSNQLGKYYQLKILHQRALVVSDPQVIADVLRARPATFRRFSSVETVFSDLGMSGLLSAEGEQWQRHRRLTMRAFDPAHLRHYFSKMAVITERLRQHWMAAAAERRDVDIQDDLLRYSVDVTAGLAFGAEIDTINGRNQALQRCLADVFPAINRRLNSPVPYWRYVKLPSDRALDRNMAELRLQIDGFIADARQRMQANPALFTRPGNLIEAFLAVRDQADSEFTDDDVYGNIFTTLLVGPDSTANVFSWITYFLCAHPDVHQAVRAEADALSGNHGVLGRFDDLSALPYMDAVAQEAMRLKPSGPILFLEAKHETNVGPVIVGPGIPIIALTRLGGLDSDNYASPERFDPTRWLTEPVHRQGSRDSATSTSNPKRPLIPFGAGARVCPGRYLAMVQIKMLGAMLARNFDVARCDQDAIAERFKFSMEPVNLKVRLTRRAGVG